MWNGVGFLIVFILLFITVNQVLSLFKLTMLVEVCDDFFNLIDHGIDRL